MRTKISSQILTFGLLVFAVCAVQAQTSPEQDRLIQAQTEYYRAQTTKLSEKPGVWQSLRDSPASAIGVLGALVALISFVFNYRVTLKQQKDTQFYEALKRFGDKDSSTVRLSAAVLIGEIATTHRAYFKSAIDQLIGGIQLEKTLVVLKSIATSISHLAKLNPKEVITRLYELNFALEEQFVINLANYLQALRSQANEADLTNNAIGSRFWSEAIVVSRFPNAQLELWIEANQQTFYRTLLSSAHRLTTLNNDELMTYLASVEDALELSSERLRLNDIAFGQVYLGTFLNKESRDTHRQTMDTLVENFLSERASRGGFGNIPEHWWDLHKGRAKLRSAPINRN
jgi:hypothetical protein